MSILRTALSRKCVYAAKESMGTGTAASRARWSIAFTLATILLGLSSPGSTATTLPDAVAGLNSELTATSSATANDSQKIKRLISKYAMTNAGSCALLAMGLSSGTVVPVSFIPGPIPVAALQADVIPGPGLTVTNVGVGPAALASGKGISSAVVSGGERFILVGLNQNALVMGTVANLTLDTSKATAGSHMLNLSNVIATDVNGTTIPLCSISGVLTK